MRPHLLLFLLVILAQDLLAATSYAPAGIAADLSSSAPLQSGRFTGWQSVRSSDNSDYALHWGTPLNVNASSVSSLASIVARELGLRAQYRLIAQNSSPTRDYLIYRELRGTLPVVGGRLNLSQNKAGQLTRVSYTSFQDWPETSGFSLPVESARDFLVANLEPAQWQLVDSQSFACWYPDAALRELRAAWWIRVAGQLPHQRNAGIVDATTGEILLEWSGIAHDVLDLSVSSPYWQPYDHSPTESAPCLYQRVLVNGNIHLTDNTGVLSVEAGNQATVTASLRGAYVEVGEHEEGNTPQKTQVYSAPFDNNSLTWTTDDASRPALNLYYHTVFIHDWVKALDNEYDALDYPMPAVANYGGNYDNAFWNGWGTYYGGGMNYGNFGMFSDVIYHEYQHGVTDGIYPDDMLPYIDQPGALNEAWSDYFACSINDDPLMGDWLTGNGQSNFRDLESSMVFPRNWVGEVHGDSPFISAPLWKIRRDLGVGYADTLAHFARYGLSELFFDYFLDVLETDDTDGNLENGTPNDDVIYDAFGRHGIGPGITPNYVIHNLIIDDSQGNNNGMVEAGESVEISFELVNDVMLFPPAATNVNLTATTEDNTISLSSSPFALGTIGPRDTVMVGPILMSIAAGAEDHWGVISFEISSDQSDQPIVFPLEFTIGVPKLHVVTRALQTDVHKFVTGTLRDMDKIFVFHRLENNQQLNIETLPDTGIVLWLSGDNIGSGLTTNDRAVLSAHVNTGGRLVMSGKNILEGIEGSAFAQDILGVDIAGRSRIRMASVIGAPFIEGETYLLTGSGGAANQDSMTILFPLDGTTPVLRFGPAGNNIAGTVSPGTGRAMVLGFGIEAVADNNPIGNESRTEFLTRLLEWGGFPTAANPGHTPVWQPENFTLQAAYPNPFNSSVRLEYNLGAARDAKLVIFDVLGREVLSTPLSTSSSSFTWQPQSSSGVYFAVLKSERQTSSPVKLLLLR